LRRCPSRRRALGLVASTSRCRAARCGIRASVSRRSRPSGPPGVSGGRLGAVLAKTRRSWCVADRARRNPGSRNRPGWFMDRSDRPPLRIALSARNTFATACNTPQPSYYSKLRHPYLNTRLSSWPISGRSNHASGSSPRDARTRRPAAPTFDWAPGSAAS
jgi:hypothetical protein